MLDHPWNHTVGLSGNPYTGDVGDDSRILVDPLDPNTLDLDYQHRMYAGETAEWECLVDEEDYLFFTRWLWCIKTDPAWRRGKPRAPNKPYFRRAESVYDLTGQREGSRTVYLHIEILTRAEGPMPTRRRCIADHLNGNTLDNRRQNLRWTTQLENNRNRFGSAYYQRVLL